MKGIILAGGSGTRLYPVTKGVSKQLLSIYDKPMVYYPLSVLLLAGIKEILLISTPVDLPNFIRLLGNGKSLGISIEYKEQPKPDGIAQAFLIGKEFIGNDNVCLILGDNIFFGNDFIQLLNNSIKKVEENKQAVIFAYKVSDPKDYGVIEFNKKGEVVSLEEKPENPKSNYAAVGLYFYPNSVIKYAQNLIPSQRGELEITGLNKVYLMKKSLSVELMGRGFTWFDTGTHLSRLEASNFIQITESRQGLKIACIEEIVYDKGYITLNQLKKLAIPLSKNEYGNYLLNKINFKRF